MQNEYNIKRFLEEKFDEDDIYEQYLAGRVFIKSEEYLKWFKALDHQNDIFADNLKASNVIGFNCVIIESAVSKEIAVCNHLKTKNITINEVEFNKPKLEKKSLGNDRYHYICNGIYSDTLTRIYEVLEHGSFSVGVCADKKSKLYKETVSYYIKLRDLLRREGYMASAVETNYGGVNRVFLMKYSPKVLTRKGNNK